MSHNKCHHYCPKKISIKKMFKKALNSEITQLHNFSTMSLNHVLQYYLFIAFPVHTQISIQQNHQHWRLRPLPQAFHYQTAVFDLSVCSHHRQGLPENKIYDSFLTHKTRIYRLMLEPITKSRLADTMDCDCICQVMQTLFFVLENSYVHSWLIINDLNKYFPKNKSGRLFQRPPLCISGELDYHPRASRFFCS